MPLVKLMMCLLSNGPHLFSDLIVPSSCPRLFILQDLAQYVNEVKRDNETLREIKQFQLSIENLVCNYQPFLPTPLTRTSGGTRGVVLEEKKKASNSSFSSHSCVGAST